MDAGDDVALLNRVAEIDAGLDETVIFSEAEAFGRRHVEPAGRLRLRPAGDDAGMLEHVHDAALGDPHRLRGRGAAARQFGRDEDLAHFLGSAVVHADRIDLDHPHGIGSRECSHRVEAAPFLCLVRQFMSGRIGQEVESASAGMEIENDVGQRQQGALEVIRDLFRHRAVRTTRKAAVEIAPVDRRGSGPRPEGRVVHCRHDDDPSLNLFGCESAGEVEQGDRDLRTRRHGWRR